MAIDPDGEDDEHSPWLDDGLMTGLGPAAAGALEAFAAGSGRHYRHERWFVNGMSGARVGSVFELRRDGDRRLILKLDRIPTGQVGNSEYARHVEALADLEQHPFRARLTEVPTDPPAPPIEVGDGQWIAFQDLAGGNLTGMTVLTALLAGGQGARLSPHLVVEPVACDRGVFAELCCTIIDETLSSWVGKPRLVREDPPGNAPRLFTVAEFLQLHLDRRLAPGARVRALADQWPGQTIDLPDEPKPLPNPFALALDPTVPAGPPLRILVGRAHGDLHTENVLVRTETITTSPEYHLIDLSRYSRQAPLTRDPVNFVLSIIALTMREHAAHRTPLVEVLVNPGSPARAMLPLWITSLLAKTHNRSLAWAESHGFGDEWWRQYLLSLVPCALTIAARHWLTPADSEWFVRLAARAAQAYLEPLVGLRRAPNIDPDPAIDQPRRPDYLAQLCLLLPEVRRRLVLGQAEQTSLVDRARAGADIGAELAEIERRLALTDEERRFGLHGVSPGWGVMREAFVCPGTPSCSRQAERHPNGTEPTCAVERNMFMRLRTW